MRQFCVLTILSVRFSHKRTRIRVQIGFSRYRVASPETIPETIILDSLWNLPVVIHHKQYLWPYPQSTEGLDNLYMQLLCPAYFKKPEDHK
jgi:hypothetical protein